MSRFDDSRQTQLSSTDVFLSPKEAAELLGVTLQTLATWRCTHRYPLRFYRVGKRKIRYSRADVLGFLAASTPVEEHGNGGDAAK